MQYRKTWIVGVNSKRLEKIEDSVSILKKVKSSAYNNDIWNSSTLMKMFLEEDFVGQETRDTRKNEVQSN
uniref:Uncharacterized protein n=1 Tax=Caenorhabditis japonica TaxID=281687 RepID=A0A8R1INT0_CAEJA